MTQLATTEEIIAEARAGRMFILVDDEDRENEGDLIIPAQFADADAVNFMAKFGRGLICLALESRQVERLGLPPMARHNAARHQTAFTVSIEAREGISTGISAADRATTIKAASNPNAAANDIVSPGHIFPLEAREGGVLVRTGHTEAAVDISRLAGLNPAGVICEIMNDDGSMARLPDLLPFAAQHGLKIGTIADLIAYRRRSERLVRRVAEGTITTQHSGDWHAITYAQSPHYAEHLALVKTGRCSPSPTRRNSTFAASSVPSGTSSARRLGMAASASVSAALSPSLFSSAAICSFSALPSASRGAMSLPSFFAAGMERAISFARACRA